jgi:hypothetical protein
MKRSFLLFALVSSLLFGLFGASSFAAVKAGAACTKAGATSITAGKKYICIKSGKKLVWNKGVVVKKNPVQSPDAIKVEAKPIETSTPPLNSTPTIPPMLENTQCQKQGARESDSKGLLECRRSEGNKLIFVRISNAFGPLSNPTSPDSLENCRLPDVRTSKLEAPAITYPAKVFPGFTNVGQEKIVVVGIDFSDSPGSGKPSNLYENDIKVATEWISWYSNSKLKWNFVTVDQWIRAPRTSNNYEVNQNGQSQTVLSNAEIKEDFLLAIENYVDLSGTSAVWIYYPENIEKINGKFADRGNSVITNKYGRIFPDIYAVGKDNYASKMPNWTYFVHETMHAQGIMGHSPREPWSIGLMLNDSSPSHILNAWDQLILDWILPSQIYCIDKNKIIPTKLKLVPMEREQFGLNSIMIKLSAHKLLVVESHREDKWSHGLGEGFYGVMVYLIDTSINVTWEGEIATGTYLLIPNVNHGQHQPQGTPIKGFENAGFGLVNGVGVASDQSGWDLNYFMYQGESITFDGVKISLVSTGDNDIVEIIKV